MNHGVFTLARFWALFIGCFLASLGTAQVGYNVDVDSSAFDEGGGGVPSSTFGGYFGESGAGFWNGISGDRQGLRLFDLNGVWQGATLSSQGTGGGGGWNNQLNHGDFKYLLNDVDRVTTNQDFIYTIDGLTPGPYRVATYTSNPIPGQSGLSFVEIPGLEGGGRQRVAGQMPGDSLEIGVTHAFHEVEYLEGTLTIRITGPTNRAFVNGFQLVQAVPEPASLIGCGLGLVLLLRRGLRV